MIRSSIMTRLALGVLVTAALFVTTISAHPIQANDNSGSNNGQQPQKRGSVFSGHGLVFGPSVGGDDGASSASITGDYGLVVSPGKVQKGDGLVVSQTVELSGVPYKVAAGDLTVSK